MNTEEVIQLAEKYLESGEKELARELILSETRWIKMKYLNKQVHFTQESDKLLPIILKIVD